MNECVFRLALVRHGETDCNAAQILQGHQGPGLNANGVVQVTMLADRLRQYLPDAEQIVCSDLLRSYETACILQTRLPRACIQSDAGWREIDIGTWAGKTLSEIALEDSRTLRAWLCSEDVPRGGGETREEAMRRVLDSLITTAAQLNRSGGNSLVVVSHGGLIQLLVASLLGLWPDGYWQIETPQTGSLTILSVQISGGSDPPRGILKVFNESPASFFAKNSVENE